MLNFIYIVVCRLKAGIVHHNRRRLLGYGTIKSDAIMEYGTPPNVTNESTAGKRVFSAVRADSDVMQ
jgi:hypothetical protein